MPTAHEQMHLFDRSWQRAWRTLGSRPASGLFEKLLSAYDQPHRKYHTLQHLGECIEILEPVLNLCEHGGEVEAALWFHDAVYEPRHAGNELESADWAVRELKSAGLSGKPLQRVHELVMATQHASMPKTQDQQILVDVDLSILAASPMRFSEYESQVREEYGWVPGWLFRHKRRALLKDFLSRDYIYSTAHFREMNESTARRNLALAM
ncbi:N-methyl-D-aspartate receptor NMDAR2C subunit [Variovorax sp. VNK109]|uniref:HD domain-containing protein n=1 Tax=Variovorax sp. VNK109 TaxID=3400919 RepID=UPI003BFD0BEC